MHSPERRSLRLFWSWVFMPAYRKSLAFDLNERGPLLRGPFFFFCLFFLTQALFGRGFGRFFGGFLFFAGSREYSNG